MPDRPPAWLDELDLETLSARKSEKWNTYPADALPAWVAEMDFPLAPPIRRVLEDAVRLDDAGYPIAPRDTGLPEVFAERMRDRFGWTVDPARTEILSDVVQGMYVGLCAFSQPGEGAIVQTPIYPPFLHAVAETGRRLVENPLVEGAGRLEIDFDALRRDSDARTRVLLLCNPHNPSGRAFDRAELEALANLAIERDWIVVTDEIHGDLLFDGRRHVPFASLGDEVAARTMTLTSATKAFNIAGLRCAIAHFGSEALHQRYRDAGPRKFGGGLGLFGLYATIAAWRDSQPWLDAVLPYLEANRDHLLGALRERFPEIRCFAPEATYLAWLDCEGLELPMAPAPFFLRHGRVVLSDGHAFGPPDAHDHDRHARINFATSRAILDEVLARMSKALESR